MGNYFLGGRLWCGDLSNVHASLEQNEFNKGGCWRGGKGVSAGLGAAFSNSTLLLLNLQDNDERYSLMMPSIFLFISQATLLSH